MPELKVINSAAVAVLILDGEELAGAKQNRIVNTTILLRAPVRDDHPRELHRAGPLVLRVGALPRLGPHRDPRVREVNKQNVTANPQGRRAVPLRPGGGLGQRLGRALASCSVASPTGAMKDAYEARAKDIDEYLGKFACLPGQKGLLVLIDGKAAGMDMVSLESAYAALHPKLVKSYAMEALALGGKDGKAVADGVPQAFIVEALACKGKRFKSVGHGWDLRFEGKGMVGSALVYNKAVIHAAFFRVTEAEKAGRMAGISRRRGFRG